MVTTTAVEWRRYVYSQPTRFALLRSPYINVCTCYHKTTSKRRKTNLPRETMGDSSDRGLHSYYGGGGYGYNSGGGYGYPSAGYGGYPPVGYPHQAAYGQHHSGHGGLGAVLGAVAGYGAGHMMPHGGHGHAHGGYVAHGGGYGGHGYGYGGGHHHGKFKHGKFGKHGGFKKWK